MTNRELVINKEYHTSHLRGNIVRWLPIKREDSVLFVGEYNQEIETDLKEKTDSYIGAYSLESLHNIKGSFEFVIFLLPMYECKEWMNSSEEVLEIIDILSLKTSQDGQVIIAISNPDGIIYQNGIPNELTGKYFDKGCLPTYNDWKDFFCVHKWNYFGYYPYPDIYFPMTIFSDNHLPNESDLFDFEMELPGIRVYDEGKNKADYKERIESSQMNAFLWVLSVDQKNRNEWPDYVKFSNERSEDFQILTGVKDSENVQFVYKESTNTNSLQHIKRIPKIYSALQTQYGSSIQINRCMSTTPKRVYLQFVKGKNLEQVLDSLIQVGDITEAIGLIDQWIGKLFPERCMKQFTWTNEFEKVFGVTKEMLGSIQDEKTLDITDVDMIFPNLVQGESDWILLDYEWTFDFPIPINYVKYRILFYYLEYQEYRVSLREYKLYERYGITVEQIELFKRMEYYFQRYIEGRKMPLRNRLAQAGDSGISLQRILNEYLDSDAVKLLTIPDEIIRVQSLECSDRLEKISLQLDSGNSGIAIQTGNKPAIIHIDQILINGSNETLDCFQKQLNQFERFDAKSFLILPQKCYKLIDNLNEAEEKTVELYIQITLLPEWTYEVIMNKELTDNNSIKQLQMQRNAFEEKNSILEEKSSILEERLQQIESNVLYKIYKKIRRR